MLGSEAGLVPEAFHLACVKSSEEERAETVYVSEAVGYKRNPNVKDKISSMKYEHGILTAEIASIKKKSEKETRRMTPPAATCPSRNSVPPL